MQYLLDDGDGCSLFQTYLNQQSLGHLLEFVYVLIDFMPNYVLKIFIL